MPPNGLPRVECRYPGCRVWFDDDDQGFGQRCMRYHWREFPAHAPRPEGGGDEGGGSGNGGGAGGGAPEGGNEAPRPDAGGGGPRGDPPQPLHGGGGPGGGQVEKEGVLFPYGGNFRALKAFVAASYAGIKLETDAKFVIGETNKSDAFRQKFPIGKVPAYESKDGKVKLTESDAIAYYLSDDTLRGGKEEVARAQVLQWILFAQTELTPGVFGWLYPSLSIMPFNKEQVVSRFASLVDLYKNLLDVDARDAFVNVSRWFDTILHQPQVEEGMAKAAYSFSYCTTPVKFDPAKLKDVQGGGEKKKEKVKKEDKPKAPKKKEEEDPAEEMDAAEAALAEESKSKDALDALPKGKWNMEDFKRFYSNNDVEQSVPYFWEKFDPENYSIWLGEYKYNSELSKVFMSSNLVTGMFQRLDKMRKNAFSSVALFGEDGNVTISGLWVWRGQELAFPLSPDWQIDYETYAWTKLDPSAPETKKLVTDYFSWEGADKEGRKFNQGKIFK